MNAREKQAEKLLPCVTCMFCNAIECGTKNLQRKKKIFFSRQAALLF
jgi:hypothetical protein